jgi:hypothetical protein
MSETFVERLWNVCSFTVLTLLMVTTDHPTSAATASAAWRWFTAAPGRSTPTAAAAGFAITGKLGPRSLSKENEQKEDDRSCNIIIKLFSCNFLHIFLFDFD